MNENLIKRIGDEYLQANHKDGETFLHTDYNEFLSIFKTSINENYYDIQRIIKGTLKVYNTTKLDGATLSRSVNGSLSSDDNTIPSSKQVKTYVDIYYNELSKKDEALSTTVSGAVSASNTAIDTANSAAFDASNALDIATQASTQASRADFNADTAMNIATELSRTKADVTEMEKRALITETGNKLLFSVDPSTYVLTIKLLDKLNNVLSTGTVDLPIESLVMNVSYDAETKSITLTLQNGEKVSFSVSALVEGLVSEDTFNQRIEQLKKDLRTELTQTITDDANSSFNQNVKNKTDSFNENSSLKTNEFNNNAAQKTLDYNNNCISKTNSFNQNSTQKLTEFNDNYTSKLNSFNSNADLRMDEYNANADNKIAEYNEYSQELNNKIVSTRNELERVKNDVLETGTDTDTYIHLEDSAMAEYQELEVDGVCEQETTQGYNVLDLSKKPYNESSSVLNGATVTENSGILTVDTTNATDNAVIRSKWEMYTSQNSILLPKGSYYTNLFLNIVNLSGESKGQLNGNFTLDEDCLMTQWFYNIAKGQKNVKLPLLISNDQTKTKYEPYTGGQPSPNPDYPQEIKTIENSLKITSCNKNIYDMSTIPIIAGTHYDESGNLLSWGNYVGIRDYVSIQPNKTYIQSNSLDKPFAGLVFFDKDKKFILRQLYATEFNTPNNAYFIKYSIYSEDNVIPTWVQIEPGDKVTPFEQHLETQIQANLPEGEFIGKINDTYKDTLKLEYNEEDGQYHLNLYKNIGKVVLDGSENITLNSNNSYGIANFLWIHNLNSYDDYGQGIRFKSTNFKSQNSFIANEKNEGCLWQKNTAYFRINQEKANDVATFKQWLSEHNVEIYYALATPYKIDLGIVDMPLSYDEITNIFTDSDLMPQINAKYYRNFITTIQNLQVNEKALKQELVDINTRLSALENATTNVASESEVVE